MKGEKNGYKQKSLGGGYLIVLISISFALILLLASLAHTTTNVYANDEPGTGRYVDSYGSWVNYAEVTYYYPDDYVAPYDAIYNFEPAVDCPTDVIIPSSYTDVWGSTHDTTQLYHHTARCFNNYADITSFTLPATINGSIIAFKLNNCPSLEKVIFLGTTAPTDPLFLANTTCPVYVPDEAVDTYKTAWASADGYDATRILPASTMNGSSQSPSTGVAVDIILPSIAIASIVCGAIYVARKKKALA